MPMLKLFHANGSFFYYFAAAMFFGAFSNALAFLVLGRMRSIGAQVGVWRSHKDWALYRQYWRVAPGRNWSRAPIIVALLSLVLAAGLMWMSVRGIQISR
jgi:hypothetical protein